MNNIFKKLMVWICNILVDIIENRATSIFESIEGITNIITTEAGKTPDVFSDRMFDIVRNINDNIILPIAGIIITYVAVTSLIQMINDKNTFHDYEIQTIYKWMIKTAIAIYLVSHSMEIIMAIFDIGRHIVSSVSGLANVGSFSVEDNVQSVIDVAQAHADEASLAPLMSMTFLLALVSLFLHIVKVLVPVIIYVRFFYIYMSIAVASVPLATLTASRFSNIGENYLKNIFALAFQAMFMVLVVVLYGLFLDTVMTLAGTDVIQLVLGILTGCALLVILLMKTESISKSLFGAS